MSDELSLLRKSQESWLGTHGDRGHSVKTRQVYGQGLVQLGRFLEKHRCQRPADVTTKDLELWRNELINAELAPASLAVYFRAVRGWFRWLYDRGEIFSDPAADFRSPRIVRGRPVVPAVSDIAAFLASVKTDSAIGVRDRAILETAYASALRRQELAGLKVADIDLAQRTIRVIGKGSRERMVPLTEEAAGWLKHYLESARSKFLEGTDSGALWLNDRGQPLAGNSLAIMIRRRSRTACLAGMTPHTLRRACATHLLSNGAHPAELQQLLGHASYKHLSQYLRLGFREMQATHAKSRPGQ